MKTGVLAKLLDVSEPSKRVLSEEAKKRGPMANKLSACLERIVQEGHDMPCPENMTTEQLRRKHQRNMEEAQEHTKDLMNDLMYCCSMSNTEKVDKAGTISSIAYEMVDVFLSLGKLMYLEEKRNSAEKKEVAVPIVTKVG